ncbi:MAG: SMC-Scp complex subunit ScpB [Acidobacteria bacterium]|nr:SMC-Scp complex subunit ScpB [Acidobacteriota bacterium]
MATNDTELRAALEAILLVAGEPITVASLEEVFPSDGPEAITIQLEEIRKALDERDGGYKLESAAGGYRYVTSPEYDSYLKKFFARQGEGRLSLAALETLAIIAYRQPITAPEVSDIRGVNCAGVIRTLLDRKLVKLAGRKNVVGSPFLYRTTKEFLLHFGLNSIQDLPRLEEFAEVLGESLAEELLGPAPGEEQATAEGVGSGVAENDEAHGVRSAGSEGEAPEADATRADSAGETLDAFVDDGVSADAIRDKDPVE